MDNIAISLEPARAMLYQVVAFLPRLLGAVLIILVGWLLAKAARFAVARALRAINFQVLTERAGLDNFLRQGGATIDTTGVVAWLVYWLVLLAALMIAFNSMGFGYMAELLLRVLRFVPNIFVALVVLAFGSYFARFVGDTTTGYLRGMKMPDAGLLGKVAQYAVMLFVILVALDQISIGGNIVLYTFLVILGGIVLALALAFGLGGRAWAAERLEHWWPSPRNRHEAPEADRRRPPPGDLL